MNTLVVGIAEMKLTGDPGAMLVTHALGSCLGIAIYDPVARVGGLLHVMMPSAEIDLERARQNPCLYVDTGLPMLFRESYRMGAKKERILLTVAGGSSPRADGADMFQIGKRNIVILRKMLWKNGVFIKGEEVGGSTSRTMRVRIADGRTVVESQGETRVLLEGIVRGEDLPAGAGHETLKEAMVHGV